MHEFSLIADLMRKISAAAPHPQRQKIVGVKVRLGALAHISPKHFREHFVQAAKGTPAENARLEIELSDDTTHPNAQDLVLKSIEVEE